MSLDLLMKSDINPFNRYKNFQCRRRSGLWARSARHGCRLTEDFISSAKLKIVAIFSSRLPEFNRIRLNSWRIRRLERARRKKTVSGAQKGPILT